MGQCNICVKKQEIYKQPPTSRQILDQMDCKSKRLGDKNKNISNKQDSLGFPVKKKLNQKSDNLKNEIKIIYENDNSQKTRAIQKKKRKVQVQNDLDKIKKNLEEKQQKLDQSMIRIQLQSQNDKKFTPFKFSQLQKTTQQSNMIKKQFKKQLTLIKEQKKIKSDPLPRYTSYADILKIKTNKSSLPLNRPQPKHLTQFIGDDLDLRKTFIPIKNIHNKILTNKQKNKQIASLVVINQTKNKSQKKPIILEQSNGKKIGPKISKICQIKIGIVDSPKDN